MLQFTFKSRRIHHKILIVNAIDIRKISFNQQNIQILRTLNHNKSLGLHFCSTFAHSLVTKQALANWDALTWAQWKLYSYIYRMVLPCLCLCNFLGSLEFVCLLAMLSKVVTIFYSTQKLKRKMCDAAMLVP